MEALRKTIESYLRNQTRLRKQSLRLSVNLKNFGDNEATQLGDFLSTFGDAVNAREMIREEAMTKVALYSIEPLKLYPLLCNKLRQEVRTRESAMDREQRKLSSLDRIMIREGGNRSKVTQNQLELVAASAEVEHSTSSLLQSVERFETQKRADIKTALGEFLQAEITYHARALELLTDVSKHLDEMDIEQDIAEICERIESATARAISPLARDRAPKSPMRSPIKQAVKESYLNKGYATGMLNSPITSNFHYPPTSPQRAASSPVMRKNTSPLKSLISNNEPNSNDLHVVTQFDQSGKPTKGQRSAEGRRPRSALRA